MQNHDNNSYNSQEHQTPNQGEQNVYQTPQNGGDYYPMDQHEIEQSRLQRKISGGRNSLILIAVLSLANIILMLTNLEISFAFSLTSTGLFYGIGALLSPVAGFLFSLIPIVLFFVLFFFSKNAYWPSVVAVIIFSLDTLFLLVLIFTSGDGFGVYIIDIIFHAWALGSLISLLSSQLKLSKLIAQSSYVYQNPYQPAGGYNPNAVNDMGYQYNQAPPQYNYQPQDFSNPQTYQPPQTQMGDELDKAPFDESATYDESFNAAPMAPPQSGYSWNMPEQPTISPAPDADISNTDFTTPPESFDE